MSAREEIASAANSVEGIRCSPYYVQSTNPGIAYVRLDRIEYPDKFGGIAYWDLVVVLPGETAQAEKYTEAKVPDLVAALDEHANLRVDRVTPAQLQVGGGLLSVVLISTHREAD